MAALLPAPAALASLLLACCATTLASAPRQPSFFSSRDYTPTGTWMAVGDVNGDGIPDLISTQVETADVLLGKGDGTFTSGPSSHTGLLYDYQGLALDVNGDGKLDLLIVGGPDGVQPPQGFGVCLGNGDGTFQSAVFYPAGNDPGQIAFLAVADFNGDGILDVVVAGNEGVWLFTGVAGGTFNPGVLAVPMASSGSALAAADFNGDGKLDLGVATTTGFVILLGNGNGTFQPPRTYTNPGKLGSSWITAADVNQDGRPDIQVGTYTGVLVYLATGTGTFSPPIVVPLPVLRYFAVGDVNGDGIPDLVSNNGCIALGNGNGTFRPPKQYYVQAAFGALNVVLASLHQPGVLDVVIEGGFAITVMLNLGKGRFEDGTWVPLTGGADCGVSADFNGDGKPDLAVNNANGITILLGSGKVTAPFKLGSTIPLPGAGCLVTGDLNGDGIPDLLVPTPTAVVSYLGNGDGTFTMKSSTMVPVLGYLALADFNRDGKLDFASSANVWALGNGDGTFQTPAMLFATLPLDGFSNIAAGDLTGDGWTDLVLTNDFYDGYVLLNNHHGKFKTPISTSALKGVQAVLADLNGDGYLDLVCVGLGGQGANVYLGNGKGGFTGDGVIGGVVFAGGAAGMVADVNGDGIPDISLVASGTLSVFLGNGDGTFQPALNFGTGGSPASVLAADLHGQPRNGGLPDIIAPDVALGVMVLINTTR